MSPVTRHGKKEAIIFELRPEHDEETTRAYQHVLSYTRSMVHLASILNTFNFLLYVFTKMQCSSPVCIQPGKTKTL